MIIIIHQILQSLQKKVLEAPAFHESLKRMIDKTHETDSAKRFCHLKVFVDLIKCVLYQNTVRRKIIIAKDVEILQ